MECEVIIEALGISSVFSKAKYVNVKERKQREIQIL